jgi:DNA-binding transcriptional LysR family regulator
MAEAGSTQPFWNDIQVFIAVARAGSASRAALELGVDHTTVGRRLRALESRLGVSLFERLAGASMTLTQAGEAMLVEAERMSAASETLLRKLAGASTGLHGTIRIASSDGVLTYWLIAAIAGFQQAHPGLSISWTGTASDVEIGRSADIGLSWQRPSAAHLVARRLGSTRALLYAMPTYVERHGLPETADDIGQHSVLNFAAYERQPAFDPWNALMVRYPPAMRLETSASSERVLREGRYIALLPSYTPQIEPSIRVAPLDLGIQVDLWLSYHEDQRRQPRVKVLAAEIERLARRARGTWFQS